MTAVTYNSHAPILRTLLLLGLFSIAASCGKDENDAPDESNEADDPIETIGLKDIDPSIGVGAHFALVNEPKYLEITKKEFNVSQVLYYAGFGGWPARDTYDFTALNSATNWLLENDMDVHLHMLFGPDQYMPAWLKSATWTPQELDTLMQEYIQTVMEANDNKNKIGIWNVINELFEDNGSYRGDMVWSQMGFEEDSSGLVGSESINAAHPIFIRKAFEYCRNYTDAKLEYRDYLIENNNPGTGWDKKHKATYQLLKHLLNTDAPLDAIGIQGHFNIGEVDWVIANNGLKEVVEKYKGLGLAVYITELDIGSKLPYTTELKEQQRSDFYNYVLQSLEGGAERIYTWGLHDGRDPFWRTDENPLLWDENLNRKDAYYGVADAIEDAKQ